MVINKKIPVADSNDLLSPPSFFSSVFKCSSINWRADVNSSLENITLPGSNCGHLTEKLRRLSNNNKLILLLKLKYCGTRSENKYL